MLFAGLFVPDRMRDAISERAWIQAMLAVEAALARAQARAGMIPSAAAAAIARAARDENVDAETLTVEARAAGNPAEPLARALRRLVPEDASRYVHYGATSQDIVDTAAMLVTRRASELILADLRGLATALAGLAETHRGTLMVARTLLQQALPSTFGLRAAGWLAGVIEVESRLRQLRDESLAVQLGGAAGTLAAFGGHALEAVRELARETGLAEPVLPWHTERTRVGESGAVLFLTSGAIDKIALDITLLSQTEVGEVSEGGEAGGSSTLPQKRNSVASVLTRACAREAQASSELLMRSMVQELERAAGAWQAEWQALSAALAFTGGAAWWMRRSIEELQVHTERMRANLDASKGLVMAERVSLLLGEQAGRDEAHALLRAAGARVAAGDGTLGEVLLADENVRRYLSAEAIETAMNPTTYLGATDAFIDRVLAQFRQLQLAQSHGRDLHRRSGAVDPPTGSLADNRGPAGFPLGSWGPTEGTGA
jgi:3-carboxy-cis,cis-muconate cycloisomerase